MLNNLFMIMARKSFSILLADDEPGIRLLLKRVLAIQGYQIYEAHDGVTALDQFLHLQPDLILLDIAMPNLDGITVLQEIRQQNQHVGILMMSAFKETELGYNLTRLGADGYLQKPFRFQTIQREIERLRPLITKRQQRSMQVSTDSNFGKQALQHSMHQLITQFVG